MPEINLERLKPFATAQDFADWLAQHHDCEDELWLKIYKKSSAVPSITWSEAVIEALCWGWIDGIKKSLDDVAYAQRFTPRRKRSLWSQINREHVERLINEGRMQPSGLLQVQAAQADGRWQAAYAPASEMAVPDDFMQALALEPKALAFFEGLNKSNTYAIAYQLQSAKKPETRQRRFDKLLAMLARGEKIH